jgi:hypothetical protein
VDQVAAPERDIADLTRPLAVVRYTAIGFAVWTVAAATVAVLRADRAWIIAHVPDDAFYYLEIGNRLSRGEGATFDGIHETNGFHPLWQGITTVLARAFHGDGLVRAALLTSIVFTAVALVVLARLASRVVGPTAAAVGLAVSLHSTVVLSRLVDGMESSVTLLALALFAAAVVRARREPSERRLVVCGAAFGFVVLARLDVLAVVPIAAIAVVLLFGARRALLAGAGAAAVVAPYLAWNLVVFGQLLTVSGSVKLHYTDSLTGGLFTMARWDAIRSAAADYGHAVLGAVGDSAVLGHPSLVGGAMLVAAGLGAWWLLRARVARAPAVALALVLLLVIAKAAFDVVASPFDATSWYAGAPLAILSFAIGSLAWVAIEQACRQAPRPDLALIGTGVVLVAVLGAPRPIADDTPNPWRDAGAESIAELQAHPPPGRLGAFDAGQVGFYLDPYPVSNLDGLANDADFEHLVVDDAPFEDRYRAADIDFVVNLFIPVGHLRAPRPTCGVQVWQSSIEVVPGQHLVVLDLRPCGFSR